MSKQVIVEVIWRNSNFFHVLVEPKRVLHFFRIGFAENQFVVASILRTGHEELATKPYVAFLESQ